MLLVLMNICTTTRTQAVLQKGFYRAGRDIALKISQGLVVEYVCCLPKRKEGTRAHCATTTGVVGLRSTCVKQWNISQLLSDVMGRFKSC